ncbi:serine/threonine-protein kinase [Streptomyces sp. t39]|uniref:serine/threonine-protein kinase n=1 Tax=Streptomyces sp. t39 TaxID=1828156 RepID=UPI00164F6B67|nr:serine/threonine-protein kinase [Streptomyces sp. t39]
MQQGTVLGGRYTLGRLLGNGGMGEVRQAVDGGTGDTVAVKTMLPRVDDAEGAKRFAREMQAMGRANSRYVVGLLDSGIHGDSAYLVMEYVDGRSLDRLLADRRSWSVPETTLMLWQLAKGLAHAHSHGILHRDVKPANIMIVDEKEAKLCDFGIAKFLGDHSATDLTGTGVVGTPAYLAPERWAPGAVDTTLSDMYAFGCVAYELLTGQHVFARERPGGDLGELHAHARPRPLHTLRADIPHALQRLVEALLAKQPEARPSADFTAAVLEMPPLRALGESRAAKRLREHAAESERQAAAADGLRRSGSLEEALREYRTIVRRRTLMRGPDDDSTLRARQAMADCLWAMQEAEDSIRLCREIAADWARTLGDTGADAIATLQALAYRLGFVGRHAEALEFLERIARARAETRGDSPVTFTAEHHWADCLLKCGRPGDAATVLRRVVTGRAQMLGTDDAETLRSTLLLADALVACGEPGEALDLLRPLESRGPESPVHTEAGPRPLPERIAAAERTAHRGRGFFRRKGARRG